ncbi:MAG: glycosyltransferase family 39 protein [Patescibacteria group bacterium]
MKLEWLKKIQKLIPLRQIPYSNYILLAILILGFIIRVYKINSLPLYGDELTIVYDSYSILKTGMDQTGQFLPLTFKMGAGRPAGYVYGSIPFIAIFGPTVWGVRGLSLLSGLGIIILMYFLGKKLFSQKIGLMASFLTSVSLWDIYLSRAGFEAHFALFLTLFGGVMFLYKKYIFMAILFGVAIFTYPTFKLTIPLLFLAFIFFSEIKRTFQNKTFLLSLAVLAVFAGFSLKETINGVSDNRFFNINTFSDSNLKESIIQKINEERNLSTLPESIKPFIYNKPLKYSRILFENYMENLSPQFLYLRGDRNPRHNPGEWGMLYLVELPLLFVGLYFLFKDNKKALVLLISWILITPLATMFLGQTHALRNNLMLPPFILISAYGLLSVSNKLKNVFIFLILIQLIGVLMVVYFFAPNKFGSFWSLEAKTASLKAINTDKNQRVVLATSIDNIEYAYPVYAKIDPKEVIAQYGKFPKKYNNVIISNEIQQSYEK